MKLINLHYFLSNLTIADRKQEVHAELWGERGNVMQTRMKKNQGWPISSDEGEDSMVVS
jgi:hypothetical protein